MIGNKLMKESNVLQSLILIVLFLSAKLNCEVTISPTSIEGMQGESRNLTITWTNEVIDHVGISRFHAEVLKYSYSKSCTTKECHCNSFNKPNIKATCSSKSITWTFKPLEIRNNGVHKIDFYANKFIRKDVTVRVFAKPSNISLNCQQDHCSNIVTCQCQASAGNPKSRLHWMLQTVDGVKKDLSNYTNTDDFDIFGDMRSNLSYRVEMEDHGGSVSCVVENKFGSFKRESAVKVQFYYTTEDKEEIPVSFMIVSMIILSVFILVSIVIGILLSLHIKKKLPSQCCFKSQLTTDKKKNIELPKQRYLKLQEDLGENDVDNMTSG